MDFPRTRAGASGSVLDRPLGRGGAEVIKRGRGQSVLARGAGDDLLTHGACIRVCTRAGARST